MKNEKQKLFAIIIAFLFLISPSISLAETFSRHLLPGMYNDEVKLLQTFLAQDKEIYPEGFVTGFYGKLTTEAVRKFQKRNAIATTGVVGPKTLSKLNSLLNNNTGEMTYSNDSAIVVTAIDPSLPVINNIVSTPSGNNVRISWETSVPTKAKIWFGAPSPLNLSLNPIKSNDFTLSRVATFSGLATSTEYAFVIYAENDKGKVATSTEHLFTTLPI